MIRCHPPIVRARHEQDRGILRSIDNVMIRRVSVERLELRGIFHPAEFGDIKCSVGREFDL